MKRIIFLTVAGVIGLTGCTSLKATDSAGKPTVVKSSSVAAPKTVVTPPPVVHSTPAPPVQPQGVDHQALVEWVQPSLPHVQTLSDDMTRVQEDTKNYDGVAASSDCQTFLTDIQSAKTAIMPTPDAELTHDLSLALGSMESSAHACSAGDFNTAATRISEAGTQIDKATARLQFLASQN
jgi:hypothetical protein